MSCSTQYHGRCLRAFVLLAGFLVIYTLLCPAPVSAGPVSTSQDAPAIQDIQTVPDFDNKAAPDREPAVSDSQEWQGAIDRIASDEIVIDDILYKLSAPKMASGLGVGDYVGFILNDAGAIVRLEKIKKPANQR